MNNNNTSVRKKTFNMTPTVPNTTNNSANKKPRLSPSSNGSAGSINAKKPSRPTTQGARGTDAVAAGTKRRNDGTVPALPPRPPGTTATEDRGTTDGGAVAAATGRPATTRDPAGKKTPNPSLSHSRTRPDKPRRSSGTKPIRRPFNRGRSPSALKGSGVAKKKSSAISIGGARKRISSPGSTPASTTAANNGTVGSGDGVEENQLISTGVDIPDDAGKKPSGESAVAKDSTSEAIVPLAAVAEDHHPYQHLGQLDPKWNIPELKENEKSMKDFCSKFVVPKEDEDEAEANNEADGDDVEVVENVPAAPVRENGVEVVEEKNADIEGEEEKASGPMVEIIDGEIVIKESSIVVGGRQTTEDVDKELAADGAIVEEDAYGITATYTSFTNKMKAQHWKLDETRTFYMALRQCGTDFSTMEQMYEGFDKPKTRKQLKSKYKREYKKNPRLIDMAMHPSAQIPLDLSLFGDLEIEETTSTSSTAIKDPTENSTLAKEVTPIKAVSTELSSVKSNSDENGPREVLDVDQIKLATGIPQSAGSKQEPSESVKVLGKEDEDNPTKTTEVIVEGATGAMEKVEVQLSSSASAINNTTPVEPVVEKSDGSILESVAKPIALFGVRKKSAQRPKFRAKARPKKGKVRRPVK